MMQAEPHASAFAEVLRAALALSRPDQAQLHAVLQRLVAPDAPAPEDPLADTEQATARAQPSGEELQAWLALIAPEAPKLRLRLVDEAIADCDDPEQLANLHAAQLQLLREHPPLAVRRKVTELAMQQPAGITFATIGLLLGIAGALRLLLRGLF